MHKYVISIMVVMLISATSVSMAQQMEVSGVVTDAETGVSLPGVNVVIQGTSQGTSTDLDGLYSIIVPSPEATLVFSYIGYETREIPINGQSEIDVALLTAAIVGEELVVVGYGTQKKVNLTGSVSSISSAEIENRPIASVEEALQGSVSGLNIVRTGGQPGDQDIDIKIRGTSTFTNNPVLVVIDGIPMASNELNKLNPNDIENISVLKDAASAAIYGSRATGGVILVTTKTGQNSGGAPKLNYSSTISRQSPTRFPEKVSALDHALLSNEARENDGSGPKFIDEEIAFFGSEEFNGENWDDYMLDDALQTNQNISLSGGVEMYDYYISIGYFKQDGTVLNTDYERLNLRLNQNIRINDQLKFSLKAEYSPSTRTEGAFGSTYSMLTNIASLEPLYQIKTEDGRWLNNRGTGGNSVASASQDGGEGILKNQRLSGIFSIDYELLPNLMFTGTYGINRNQSRQRDYQRILSVYDQGNPDVIARQNEFNRLRVVNAYSNLQNASLLGNYNNNFGDHDLSVLGGFTAEWFINENDAVETQDFLTDNIFTISAGSSDPAFWGISGGASDWALASFISRINYSFRNKYLFETVFRYDGSSRFVEDLRWGLFPSISAGWIVSRERFLQSNEILTFLKLRGSWGQVGNQNVGFYPFASSLAQSAYYFNASPQRTVRSAGAANPGLTWETKESVNLGLEASFFSSLLELEVDLFREETSDILLQLPLPTTFGLTEPVQNAGIVQNKGWEIELSHRNTIGDFSYGLSFNISDAKNEVLDMGGISPRISGNTITEEGYSMNEWFGIEADGFFQSQQEVDNHAFQNPQTSPGDIKFIDQNGDGVINSEDRVRLGSSDPRFPYGIRLNLNYKNLDLKAFGQGVVKHKVWSNGWTAQNFDRENSTLRTYHLDRWTPDNPDAKFPKTRMGSGASDSGINDRFSSFWLEDAGYFRLKHIELGYNLPVSVLDKVKIAGARIFVSGENLFTATDYLGYDPEIGTGTSSRLVERRYPLSKVYNLGLNINF